MKYMRKTYINIYIPFYQQLVFLQYFMSSLHIMNMALVLSSSSLSSYFLNPKSELINRFLNPALLLALSIFMFTQCHMTASIHSDSLDMFQCSHNTKYCINPKINIVSQSVFVSHMSVFVETPLKHHFGCTVEVNNRRQLLSLTEEVFL